MTPFDTPTMLRNDLNSVFNDYGAFLTGDERTAYFASDRPGGSGADIWYGTRSTADGSFGTLTPLAEVSSGFNEASPSVTGDHLALYFSRYLGPPEEWRIWGTSRDTADAPFAGPTEVPDLNENASTDPYVLPDHSAVYFATYLGASTGAWELYRAERSSAGLFGAIAPVNGINLNTASDELSPVITPDQRVLYFSSNRAGGMLARDIYVTTRADAAGTFGDPMRVAELSTGTHVYPSWISPDACVLFYHGEADHDIHAAFRQPP